MPPIAIASIAFACVFGSALLGMLLRTRVPQHHLNQDSKDVVKLAMGLVATMAALVLGLLTASAKSSFDTQDSELQQSAAKIVLLDRVLAHYGPETKEVRGAIRSAVAFRLAQTWPEDGSQQGQLDTSAARGTLEGIEGQLRALSPHDDSQRGLQVQAQQLASDVIGARWLLIAQSGSAIPLPFLVILIFWLSVLFVSFGLFAPGNATVMTALLLCALSVSGSLFLILEMDRPLDGFVKVSSAPLHFALSHLGQ